MASDHTREVTGHDKLDKFIEGGILHVPATIVVCSNDIPKGRNHGCKP